MADTIGTDAELLDAAITAAKRAQPEPTVAPRPRGLRRVLRLVAAVVPASPATPREQAVNGFDLHLCVTDAPTGGMSYDVLSQLADDIVTAAMDLAAARGADVSATAEFVQPDPGSPK